MCRKLSLFLISSLPVNKLVGVMALLAVLVARRVSHSTLHFVSPILGTLHAFF